jgi:4-amino-4-deoxy-L-arabinose transferase-like glycosyltransferase
MKISNKKLYTFLIIVAAVKVFFSFFLELGNDESYYYTYALKPQLNYFDHPLMVGILIRLSTFNLLFVNDVLLRLGPTICCFIASVFIFKIGKLLYNDAVGWYATLLYNLSIYTGFIAGWFILPDSPQMPLWCASLYVMCKLIFSNKDKNVLQWILLGTLIGLAALSKIHALYLWGGFGLFILFYRTKWLLNWRLYLGFIVTLIFLLPILIWNIQSDFITYRFHSQRVTNTQVHFDSLLREIMGEAMYQNPIVFVLIIVALVAIVRRKMKEKKQQLSISNLQLTTRDSKLPFLLFLGLPMIFLFWYISLRNDIFPHWSGPAYIPLFIIAAVYLSNKTKKQYPNVIKASITLIVVSLVSITLLSKFAPFNLGSQNKENYGEYCPTLDISGWKDFSNEFDKIVKQDIATNKMKVNSSIIVSKWFPACQLELYTSPKTGLQILVVGDLENLHHYAWLNKERKPLKLNDDAYCIVPSNVPLNVETEYSKYFTSIEKPDTINQMRGGKAVRYFYIYRLKNCKELPQDILYKNILTK